MRRHAQISRREGVKSAAFCESYEIQSQTRNARGSGLFFALRRVLLVFFPPSASLLTGVRERDSPSFRRAVPRDRVYTPPLGGQDGTCRVPGRPRSRRRDARSPPASRPAFRRAIGISLTPSLSPPPMISQPAVPETALKRRKRDEAWAAKKATADAEAAAASKKNSEEIFKRAEKYVKEYRDQVRFGETRPRVPHTNTSLFPTPARRRPAAARRERAKTRSDRRGGFGE